MGTLMPAGAPVASPRAIADGVVLLHPGVGEGRIWSGSFLVTVCDPVEESYIIPWIDSVGIGGWAFTLYEAFAGEGGQMEFVGAAFYSMHFIVTVGWSIYWLGYFFTYL